MDKDQWRQRQYEERRRRLERERRRAYLRWQQRYWNRLRQDRLRLQNARYYNSLIYNCRYDRGGRYYYTSSYGAQMLRNAVNYGYQEGFYAGQADRDDGWGYSYRDSFAYQDASYGYDGYYVSLDEYQYYFREGFRRGYEDGYYGRYNYGYYDNGGYSLVGSILKGILNIVVF
ncbi:MAG: hypothetical protein R2747_03230 [Pyrinomonadaceae bacterium]